ncbi:dehydratase [Bacillus luteolus]|uniref:Dehydratase n=1 Tax=Litchfieldia luteola TaxID=682179 RepID=A0ABR9QML0_9BACI|nr:MaoC/PaaZ C-terminal domain-containing protein [Cytobacillus luteolus]MBE4909745.1 dehydratase [Cytobacillus luteolus]MBP1944512.1 acyl dehydratase [Cytobacillus luteolus]
MKTIEVFQVGESLEEVQLSPVTRIDLIKYAGASGDYNPIHTIDEEATKVGLPGIIAHGMWTMGNLSKLFTPYLEEGFIENYTIRFRGMVFLKDVITLKAKVVETAENKVHFDVAAVNQDGAPVIKGKVVFSKYL